MINNQVSPVEFDLFDDTILGIYFTHFLYIYASLCTMLDDDEARRMSMGVG